MPSLDRKSPRREPEAFICAGKALRCKNYKSQDIDSRLVTCIQSLPQHRGQILSKGYVYILTNPAMPGMVKIGRTERDPDQRSEEISKATGVPMPFEIYNWVFVPDCHQVEAEIHAALDDCRVNADREFFRIDPMIADAMLHDMMCAALDRLAAHYLHDGVVATRGERAIGRAFIATVEEAIRRAEDASGHLCSAGKREIDAIITSDDFLALIRRNLHVGQKISEVPF